MFQNVVILGNLGADPEMRYLDSGTAVTNLRVAVNRVWNNSDGERQEETTWFRVSVWGKQAEACNQYLEKGRAVLVQGTMQEPYAYIHEETGEARASLQLRADRVQFVGWGKSDDYDGGYDEPDEAYVNDGQEEDDIPF